MPVAPAASHDKNGKPLLCWRVHILPYLGEEKLYKEFHLDEPWDSPHNKKLLSQMPKIYRAPGALAADTSATYYQVFVGKKEAGVKVRPIKPDWAQFAFPDSAKAAE